MAGKQNTSLSSTAPSGTGGNPPPTPQPTLEVIEYQWLRFLVGAIAGLFPILLVYGDLYLCDQPFRDSLSRYYDGHMRNVFVAGLSSIGVFLLSYRGESIGPWGLRFKVVTKLTLWKWLERLVAWFFKPHNLGIIAGIAAIGVAFDPVSCPAFKYAHYFCAAVLFAALARFSWLFGDTANPAWSRFCKTLWLWFYRFLSAVIIVMIVWIAFDVPYKSSILGQEWTAVWAFALGWIVVSRKAGIVGRTALNYAVNTLLAPIKLIGWVISNLV